MEPQFQTSFIPKKPLTQEVSSSPRGKVSILNFVSTVFFIGTIVVSGFVYFYVSGLNTKLSNLKSNLEQEKQAFDYDTIETLQQLSKRIMGAKEILSNHLALSPIFDLIEEITLKTVQYTKFDYTQDINDGSIEVKLSGIAPGYKSIGLQEEEFTKNRYIKNPVFTNLILGEKGEVSFDVEFTVDKTYLAYGNTISVAPLVPKVEEEPEEVVQEEVDSLSNTTNVTNTNSTESSTTTNTSTSSTTTNTQNNTNTGSESFFGNPFDQN